jgi:hypothetical protein
MELNTQRVTDAINHLIEAPNYIALVRELNKIIETWSDHPMVYSGQLRHLNALIDVGLHNKAAFDRLIKLAEDRRRASPRAKRTTYQRELMRDRRSREAKSLELHEQIHGPLRGAARIEFLANLRERWRGERERFIQSKGGNALDWKGRNDAANEFWSMVDRKLDMNLADTRRKRA